MTLLYEWPVIGSNFSNKAPPALKPQSIPALDEKLERIAFNSGLDSELHKCAVANPNSLEDFLDNSVFFTLRIDLEAVFQQAFGIGMARLGKLTLPIAQ
jgi:hypothetical protein